MMRFKEIDRACERVVEGRKIDDELAKTLEVIGFVKVEKGKIIPTKTLLKFLTLPEE